MDRDMDRDRGMGERVETSIRREQQRTWPLLASHPHLLLVMLVDIVVLIEHLELECLVTQTCCDTPMDGVSYKLLPWLVLLCSQCLCRDG